MKCLSLLALCALVSPASASIVNVPGDYATIQEAIQAALPGDEIVVAPGVYPEALDLLGKDLRLRSRAGREVTIVDGAGLNASLLRVASGETLAATVEGFSFRNGRGEVHPTCAGAGPIGGAIYLGSASALTLRDCVLEQNGVGTVIAGAGIYVANGTLVVEGCHFAGNGVHDQGSGGAIGSCATNSARSISISDSSFVGNGAGFGGAANLSGFGSASVERCTFEANTASHGGALRLNPPAPFGWSWTVLDSSFVGNVSAFGGGINAHSSGGQADQPALLRIEDCDFFDNSSGFGGGLLAVAGASQGQASFAEMYVRRCTFQGNEASDCCNSGNFMTECYGDGVSSGRYWGGAADLRTIYGGLIEVSESLFHDNRATLAGGLHLSTCGGGSVRLLNSTVAGNGTSGVHVREGEAQSLQVTGNVTIANSIVSGNGLADADQILADIDVSPSISFETRYTLVQGDYPGPGNIDGDPLFQDPEVGVFCPSSGSPAIDAGDNGAVALGVAIDLQGANRFEDDPNTIDTGVGPAPVVDMGASEFQGGACLLGTAYCDPALPNTLGLSGSLGATGSGAPVSSLRLQAADLPANRASMFIVSRIQGMSLPMGSAGRLCLAAPIGRFNRSGEIALTSASGERELLVDTGFLPSAVGSVQRGDTLNFQLWHRDAMGSSNFTSGLSIQFE